MKLSKIVLSLTMIMTLVPGINYVNAAESYVSDSDLSTMQVAAPKSWGVTPTNEQYRYQKEELAGFVHFGPNTFNEIEWGENYGNKTPDVFVFGIVNIQIMMLQIQAIRMAMVISWQKFQQFVQNMILIWDYIYHHGIFMILVMVIMMKMVMPQLKRMMC